MSENSSRDKSDGAVDAAVVVALRRVLRTDDVAISGGTDLREELGLDSTSILKLLVEIEDELGIEFDPDSLNVQDFATVDTLSSCVRRQIENVP